MRCAVIAFALAFLAASDPSASAEGNEIARARSAFEAILDGDADGSSLTRRVHDFLSLDPPVVRTTEAEAWELSGHRVWMENHLRFLHGMAPRITATSSGRSGFAIVGGAVVWLQDSGGPGGPHQSVEPRSFDEFFGQFPTLTVPIPKAADLLAFLRSDARQLRTGRRDFAQALGETCADDDAGFTELTRQFDEHPDDHDLCTAMGWSRRPAAVRRLVARVRVLATDLAATGSDRGRPGFFSTVLRALSHADREALDQLVGDFAEPIGDRLVAYLGDGSLVHRRVAAFDAASTAPTRLKALRRLCDLQAFRDAGSTTGTKPRGEDARRLLHALLEAVDSGDPDLRIGAFRVVEWLQYLPAVGPETTLRRLADDVDAGRIVFRGAPSIWERTAPPADAAQCKVSAEWVPDGLRVRLANVSDRPFALNLTALRHASAYVGDEAGSQTPTGKFLHLQFPPFDAHEAPRTTFTASCLVVVRPQGVQEVVIPLTKEFRGLDHVKLALAQQIVLGESPAPVVWFNATQVL